MLKQSLLLHVFHEKKMCCSKFWDYISFDATQSLMLNGFVHTRFFGDYFSRTCILTVLSKDTCCRFETTHRSQQKIINYYIPALCFRLKKREEGLRFCELFQTVFVTYSDNHIFLPTICLNSIFVLF